ncbi:MAG: site-2 protease family protein [Actinomycetota bacterium]|nr:site-2 protease family protein [Actinomycetota bacterium]MDZ4180476.1 site-2 protease family protein [Coriobacteriia bacterium]
MSFDRILDIGVLLLILFPAIILHEVAHGYVAYLLGDTTAKDRGRLSLNPIRHVDPFGTFLLPLLLLLGSGGQIAFGYAKPVPVNTWAFKNQRQGMFLVGIAGPATNLVLAFLSGLAFQAVNALGSGTVAGIVAYVFLRFCLLNLVLMFFNLIPLPPLDGSRILPLFLSDRAMVTYDKIERYGFVILIATVWFLPDVIRMLTGQDINPIGWYFSWTVSPVFSLFAGIG